jgi:hypothetical protein
MPTKRYSLNPGEAPRVELTWGVSWKNLRVSLDGKEIGTIPSAKELKAGQEFPLGDGTTLQVQLHQNFIAPELRVLRNGRPLPGSASDPAERVRVASQVVYFIAGLNIVVGLLVGMFHVDFLRIIGAGWPTFFTGVIYLVLGYFVQRRSFAALVAAVALFALDGIATLADAAATTGRPVLGGIFVRIILIATMARGLGAIRELKREEAGQDVYAGA